MSRIFISFIIIFINLGILFGQPRVKIKIQAVTPEILKQTLQLTGDSSITTGLHVVANRTWVYFTAVNIGDTTSITNATWTLLSKPSSSNSSISSITGLSWWSRLKPDTTGTYEVKVTITTSSGTKDTTTKIYSSRYVGVGGFGGISAQYPNCMSCHAGNQNFQNIFNRWKVSGHAVKFKYDIDSGSSSFGVSCMKCHTTGYDHNLVANNNGFDDKARELGWVWSNYSPPKGGNWDTIVTRFTTLVQFATIGCETCHGPGSEHALGGGDTNKIAIDYSGAPCGKCHDSPWRHPKFSQFRNSMHSNLTWSSSFAQSSSNSNFMTNNLGNCIRCHDGKGYVNFTYGRGTNTTGFIQANQLMINCSSCHDPHGNTNHANLRNRPANCDTLATGQTYNELDAGKVCLDCHKSRNNNVTYTQTRITSSHWGTHYGTQGDVLLGKNAATFGNSYGSGSHKDAVENGCIGCHMAPTTDTGTVTRDKVGGHSFNLHYAATNYDHVTGCTGCHPGKTKFTDWIAPWDFDGDGNIEAWVNEVQGLQQKLRIALPPVGIDSVSWQLIAADSFNVTLRKAYWNHLMIKNDGSYGLHNPAFTVQVLQASLNSLIGIEPISTEVPERFELSQNYPNPFNPLTNIRFSVAKHQQITITIYDLTGRKIYTLVNEKLVPGKYEMTWNGINLNGEQVASGVYFYRMVTNSDGEDNFIDVKKMVLVK